MELYSTDLETLNILLQYVEDISSEAIFMVEIRVKLHDERHWVVLGWGEAGDPCVLRFESDPEPVVVKPNYGITINKDWNNLLADPGNTL